MIWLSGILIALSVHAAGLLLFRVEEEKTEQPEAEYSFVSLPPGGEFEGDILHEWAYLLDSSPLYFPTRWNLASGPEIRALEERPDPLFASFPARLSYGDRDFGLGAIVTARMESPLEGLRAFGDFTHTVFGEGRVELTAARERFALLEVLAPD